MQVTSVGGPGAIVPPPPSVFIGVKYSAVGGANVGGFLAWAAGGFIYDDGPFWSAVNPSRFTVPAGNAGFYLFGWTWNATAVVARSLRYALNGGALVTLVETTAGNITSTGTVLHLNAGDFIEMGCSQIATLNATTFGFMSRIG